MNKEKKEPLIKQVVLDKNARDILNEVKERMKAEGMTGNSYSDAIRWLNNKLNEVQTELAKERRPEF
ncbi:MAG: hypothetical protein J7J52_01215 [Deltaproteobacteria bacterium]|nr:hypothetical protein [Deltaproteobacteria bacterium]